MLVDDELQTKGFEHVELDKITLEEKLVLQMFRQLNKQQQKDVLRFFEVLIAVQ
ncbi:hypothetical protein CF150_24789 [Pseudomonas sp. CF150]|nr:hypothetical protein CF150_24789 [Pseudomonas sp. CF150]